jgi:DNA-binding CsgD family transcriptional regulator
MPKQYLPTQRLETPQAVALARIIRAIGEPGFAALVADAVLDFMQFDLGAVVVHRGPARPQLMFDNFDAVGARAGIDNYLAVTHRFNPMLPHAGGRLGAIRARDFGRPGPRIGQDLRPYLVPAPEEELGFRTVGWPERLEEVGLYFQACGGVVEMSVYRERRARQQAAAAQLALLEEMQLPIAEAFDKHARLTGAARTPAEDREGREAREQTMVLLSPREAQVAELLLAGCGSEAIALRLGIGRYTVKDHRKNIFRKLDISSLAELFARCAPKARSVWPALRA